MDDLSFDDRVHLKYGRIKIISRIEITQNFRDKALHTGNFEGAYGIILRYG